MTQEKANALAIWAVTPKGAALGRAIAHKLPNADLWLSASLSDIRPSPPHTFTKLSHALADQFGQYTGHIFIMSAGIVLRVIAAHIRHKTADPAVVVADEMGHHVISLLSGHIGGANALARTVAQIIGAIPVITTATDLNKVPAIDVIAKQKNLFIENPDAIKTVSMALLTHQDVYVHDPFGILWDCDFGVSDPGLEKWEAFPKAPGVFIDDVRLDLPPRVLLLRPCSLLVGMGCNRDTDMEEMAALLDTVLKKFSLAPGSLKGIASIDVKKDETGLIALGKALGLPLVFFGKDELNQVREIENPSEMVEKHVGVKSVCEAAAILASDRGRLIVPKHTSRNVTVAIARTPSGSLASGQETRNICQNGQETS